VREQGDNSTPRSALRAFLDIEETDDGIGDEEAFEGMNVIPGPL